MIAMPNDEEMITLIKNAAQEGQFHKIPTEEMELIYQQGFELTQNRPYDKDLVKAVAQFKEEIVNRKGSEINTRPSNMKASSYQTRRYHMPDIMYTSP